MQQEVAQPRLNGRAAGATAVANAPTLLGQAFPVAATPTPIPTPIPSLLPAAAAAAVATLRSARPTGAYRRGWPSYALPAFTPACAICTAITVTQAWASCAPALLLHITAAPGAVITLPFLCARRGGVAAALGGGAAGAGARRPLAVLGEGAAGGGRKGGGSGSRAASALPVQCRVRMRGGHGGRPLVAPQAGHMVPQVPPITPATGARGAGGG